MEAKNLASQALGVTKRYVVWLPKGYDDSTHRFQVLFLLHGLGGNENNWVDHGGLPKTADALGFPAIVVMPDGDDSFYINGQPRGTYESCLKQKPPFDKGEPPASYCVRTPLYDDYIVKELVAAVDGAYRTVAGPKTRAIAGLSMGGFGALSLALRHPDVFGATASHSGMASLLYVGPHPYNRAQVSVATDPGTWGGQYGIAFREHVKSVFGPSIDAWRTHDPSMLGARLQPGSLAVYLDCGASDGFKFQDHAQHLHDVLEQRGVAHQFAVVPGGHDWPTWRARLPESLRFFAAWYPKD